MSAPVHDPAWWAEYARECAAIARKAKRFREAKHFGRLAAGLDAFSVNYEALRTAGQDLSNVAHHFGQRPVSTGDAEAKSAREACERWDGLAKLTPRGAR